MRPLLALALILTLFAAGCDDPATPQPDPWIHEGAVTLTSQAQVDSMAGVTVVEGNLTIADVSQLDPIRDLAPLRGLTTVLGSVEIAGNRQLQDLSGLGGLRMVAGDLIFGPEAVGGTLSGLAPPDTVRSLSLAWHDGRTPLADLCRGKVRESLTIEDVDGLTDLSPLAPLPRAFSLRLMFLDDLESLAGPAELDSLRALTVFDCDRLASLDGLPPLPVLMSLTLASSATLIDLRGLPPVPSLLSLTVDRMPQFTGFDGLSGPTGPLWVTAWDCNVFRSLAALPSGCGLSGLTLYQCEAATDLDGPVRLVEDAVLRIRELSAVTDLAWLELPSRLRRFELQANPLLVVDFQAMDVERSHWIRILDNPGLDQCAAQAWAELAIAPDGYLSIHDNGPCAP